MTKEQKPHERVCLIILCGTLVSMIELTNLGGKKILVNVDLIRLIELNPDSTLVFIDGTRTPVRESANEIQNLIIKYKTRIRSSAGVEQHE